MLAARLTSINPRVRQLLASDHEVMQNEGRLKIARFEEVAMNIAYSEKVAEASLARSVECSWSVVANATGAHAVAPDGCVDIIYMPDASLSVVGTMTVQQNFTLPLGQRIAGVRFRPGMAGSFLRVAMSELTDHLTALEDLWDRAARELRERIVHATSAEEVQRLLLASLPPAPAPSSVQRAIEFMSARNGSVDLEFVARQASLSPRQFRRRCLEETGLTPKHLCRVLRFRHARTLAQVALKPNWSDIAVAAGYFDQAHLIRDFREFTRQTPMSVFSNTPADQ